MWASAKGLGGATLALNQPRCWAGRELAHGGVNGDGAGGSWVQGPGWTIVIHGCLLLALRLLQVERVGLVLEHQGEGKERDN